MNVAAQDVKQRFLSLDVFRGLTVCLMIIVNTPGPGAKPFSFLDHAPWFGFTLADLVFPSFLFAVGNALSFSIKKYGEINEAIFLKKVLKRTILIFLIGYLMYWFPFVTSSPDGSWILKPIATTRIMGVLQRIALCYCFAALIAHYFSVKNILMVSIGILLVYWISLYLFGETGAELTKQGYPGTMLDKLILGEAHMYKKDQGEGIPFDPEGILSTLPSIVNVIAGYLAGMYIRQQGKNFEGIAKLLMSGALLLGLAVAWNLAFPIAKKLWTSSFVIYTVGIDLSILAILIYFIEMLQWKSGTYFFQVFGKNPLFIYLFSEVFVIALRMFSIGSLDAYEWFSITFFQSIIPGPTGALLCSIIYMLVCWVVGFILDKKKIYIKI